MSDLKLECEFIPLQFFPLDSHSMSDLKHDFASVPLVPWSMTGEHHTGKTAALRSAMDVLPERKIRGPVRRRTSHYPASDKPISRSEKFMRTSIFRRFPLSILLKIDE
jgi:hypothetical protein